MKAANDWKIYVILHGPRGEKFPYETNGGAEKTKLGFTENNGLAAKLLITYFTQLNNISQNQFMKVWQKQNFNLALHHLQHGQVPFVQDFQMNMLLYIQDEPNTIYWDHAQATVHPTSLFYVCPNPKCNKIVHEDLIHISPDKDHDKYAVKMFFETSVMHLNNNNNNYYYYYFIFSLSGLQYFTSKVTHNLPYLFIERKN